MKPKKLKCIVCDRPFLVKKNLYAKFCSDACRKTKSRRRDKGHAKDQTATLKIIHEQMERLDGLMKSENLSVPELTRFLRIESKRISLLSALAKAALQKEKIQKLASELKKI